MAVVPEHELAAYFQQQIEDALTDLAIGHRAISGYGVCKCGDALPCMAAGQLSGRVEHYRERLEATTRPSVPARQVKIRWGWRQLWPMWSRPA